MKALALLVLFVVALQAGFLYTITAPAQVEAKVAAPAQPVEVARSGEKAPAPAPQPARS